MPIPHHGNGDTRWQEIFVMQEVLEGDYEFLLDVWFFAVYVLVAMVERATDIISGAEGPERSVDIPQTIKPFLL